VAITGGFTSSVVKPKDQAKGSGDKDAAAKRLIEHSPPDTRMVVFGSSAFVSDLLIEQLDSDFTKSNIELIHNAVDWTLADTDLLAIRSRNEAARALTVDPKSRGGWLIGNIVIAIVGLGLVVGIAWLRRRSILPIIAKEA